MVRLQARAKNDRCDVIFALRYWKYIAAGLAVLALVSTIVLHFRSDAKTRDKLALAQVWQTQVIDATKQASGNEGLRADTTPGQIIALGESVRNLKDGIAQQNRAIDEMAREAVRMKARQRELQAIADKAVAQRQSALRRLSDLSLQPGTRDDCMTLLAEAEEALDLVHGALR